MAPKQKPGSSKQDYQTPPEFLIAVKRYLEIDQFAWDVAATNSGNSATSRGYFTQQDDAFQHSWSIFPGWNWLNPPYEDIAPWVERAYREFYSHGVKTAVLIPGSHGANWWKLWVDGKARVLDLNGRITFVGETDPYPKDCALLLYGPDVVPGYEIWTWMDDLTDEERSQMKQRTAKPKADKVTKISDGPKRRGKKFAHSLANAVQDINPPAAGKHVGDPLIPGPIVFVPDDAAKTLKELGDLNDRALAAKYRYEGLKEDTKAARETYDSLAAEVLRKIQAATHPPPLPLFDAQQREADHQAMIKADNLIFTEDGRTVDVNEAVDASVGLSEVEPAPDTDPEPIASPAVTSEAESATESIF